MIRTVLEYYLVLHGCSGSLVMVKNIPTNKIKLNWLRSKKTQNRYNNVKIWSNLSW